MEKLVDHVDFQIYRIVSGKYNKKIYVDETEQNTETKGNTVQVKCPGLEYFVASLIFISNGESFVDCMRIRTKVLDGLVGFLRC